MDFTTEVEPGYAQLGALLVHGALVHASSGISSLWQLATMLLLLVETIVTDGKFSVTVLLSTAGIRRLVNATAGDLGKKRGRSILTALVLDLEALLPTLPTALGKRSRMDMRITRTTQEFGKLLICPSKDGVTVFESAFRKLLGLKLEDSLTWYVIGDSGQSPYWSWKTFKLHRFNNVGFSLANTTVETLIERQNQLPLVFDKEIVRVEFVAHLRQGVRCFSTESAKKGYGYCYRDLHPSAKFLDLGPCPTLAELVRAGVPYEATTRLHKVDTGLFHYDPELIGPVSMHELCLSDRIGADMFSWLATNVKEPDPLPFVSPVAFLRASRLGSKKPWVDSLHLPGEPFQEFMFIRKFELDKKKSYDIYVAAFLEHHTMIRERGNFSASVSLYGYPVIALSHCGQYGEAPPVWNYSRAFQYTLHFDGTKTPLFCVALERGFDPPPLFAPVRPRRPEVNLMGGVRGVAAVFAGHGYCYTRMHSCVADGHLGPFPSVGMLRRAGVPVDLDLQVHGEGMGIYHFDGASAEGMVSFRDLADHDVIGGIIDEEVEPPTPSTGRALFSFNEALVSCLRHDSGLTGVEIHVCTDSFRDCSYDPYSQMGRFEWLGQHDLGEYSYLAAAWLPMPQDMDIMAYIVKQGKFSVRVELDGLVAFGHPQLRSTGKFEVAWSGHQGALATFSIKKHKDGLPVFFVKARRLARPVVGRGDYFCVP